jgi:homopolymeric O-antigen transport system ATP-binding protein
MGGEPLIRLEGVSKKYCRTLKRSVWYGMQDIAREIAGLAVPADRLRADEFWALRDLSLEVRRGECLGIVGPNGSGKSTLLKLISGIFPPDTGTVKVRGRVGALIEVGAGFHPMLTGRENIYINGAVLGMRKSEIDRKLDEIVAFSGLEEFLDMPVKHYSSGMYVRLGFAVAAHVEPDILLIDEVLAVGDMAFTAKCLRHVSALKQRCAVLLVSHDMRNIARMSDNVLYLSNRRSALLSHPEEAIQKFREDALSMPSDGAQQSHESVEIADVQLDRPSAVYRQFEDITVSIHVDIKMAGITPVFNIAVHRSDGVHCFGILSEPVKNGVRPGRHEVILKLLRVSLMPGQHYISVFVLDEKQTGLLAFHEQSVSFVVVGDERTRGVYMPEYRWLFDSGDCARRDTLQH